eukprot:g22438.t1
MERIRGADLFIELVQGLPPPIFPPEGSKVNREDVEVGQADVTDSGSLALALAGVSAVVFAAAYSRGKTEPKDVDNDAWINDA